jgi:ribosome-binding protein aMBF1 (putative translation factor)
MERKFKDLERRQILKKFASLASLPPSFERPPEGWVRTTRKALSMTMAQLAQRLGVQQSRIAEIVSGVKVNEPPGKPLRQLN